MLYPRTCAAVLLSIGLLIAPAGADELAHFQTHELKLSYPAGWTRVQAPPSEIILLMLYADKPTNEPDDIADHFILVRSRHAGLTSDDLKRLMEKLVESDRKDAREVRVVKEEALEIDGLPARRMIVDVDRDEGKLRRMYVCTVRNEVSHNFIFIADQKDFEKWSEQVDRIVMSTRWKD